MCAASASASDIVGKRASTESPSPSSIESGSSWRAIQRSTPVERTAASSPGRGPNARRLSTCRTRSSAVSAPVRPVAGATALSVGVDVVRVLAHPAKPRAASGRRGMERAKPISGLYPGARPGGPNARFGDRMDGHGDQSARRADSGRVAGERSGEDDPRHAGAAGSPPDERVERRLFRPGHDSQAVAHHRPGAPRGRSRERAGAAGGSVHRQAGPARAATARGGTRRSSRILGLEEPSATAVGRAPHTGSWERSLHVRVVRGSSSIAEQVASYHQVPVQIRPPALFLQVFKETPVLIVALCQLAAGPVPAPSRAAATVVEYLLPRPRAFPHDPAVGRDGIVWYTDQANSYIGRLDPATGQVTDYATPTQASGPHGIIVAPDGGVWYTANFKARRSEEHTSELQSPDHLVCRLLLEKKNKITYPLTNTT